MSVDQIEILAKYLGIYTSELRDKIVPFDMNWYMRYGTSIMIATIIKTLLTPIVIGMQSTVLLHREKLIIPNANTHKELLSSLKSYDFALEKSLANLVSFTVTSLVLLPGMPLMTLCLFGLMLSQFWVQKYFLINSNSILDISYERIFRIFIKGIPLALMLSLIAGFIVYTNINQLSMEDFLNCDSFGQCKIIQFLVRYF